MSGSNNVLITDTDPMQAQRLQEQTSSLPNIGNDGKHTIQKSGNATNLDIAKVTKAPNFSNQTGNQNVRKTTVNDKPVFVSFRSNVDKALDTLWTIEMYLDEAEQKPSNFRTDSVFGGTVKNLFCKFLGFFCSAVKENRTKALDLQINNVLKKICEDEVVYDKVFLSVMNDRDIDEELKTTFSNLFEDRKKLFSYLESPDEGIVDVLKNYKDVIKNGKLFGNDVCDRWLSPLMNDENTTEKTKLDLCTFFDDNPDIQDKLFKSLKNPPNEIRKKFWERHEEEIVSGEIFGFVGSDNDKNPYGKLEIKDLFWNNEYPLATLFLTMAKARSDLDKSIFADKKNWKLMQNSDQQKEYMKAACSLTQEQVFQSLENARKIDCNNVAEDQSKNIGKVLNFLKDPQSDNIDVPEKNFNGALYTAVVKDTRRSMYYSFIFGKTKIDLSELSKSKTEDPKVFFETLKSKLYNARKECLLNENQLEQLVNFIFYSPSQDYLAAQLGNVIYQPFAGDMSVQVAFNENEGPVITIENKNAYDFMNFDYYLDVKFTDLGFKPHVQTSGTLKLTYENPIDASNVNKYKISVENYKENITLEKP